MDEATRRAALAAAASTFHFDLQLFAEDDSDPELGEPLQIDLDALGDDPAKLKSMLGKAMHDNAKVRKEAGKRRKALRTVEGERDELKTKLTTVETDREKFKTDLETANRSNGQHLANFKKGLIDRDLKSALKEAGIIELGDDLFGNVLESITKGDGIKCDEAKDFEITGVKEAVDTFKDANKNLFTAANNGGGNKNRGTGTGAGPTGGGTGGGDKGKVDYRDTSKPLEQLEREADMARWGQTAPSLSF